ncbi:MAG: BrnA antitoxin family protein [Spirulinaceae cyanobacterium RM2_2_10]|nr:BrnA antitoxin family protein [Spirulinaceae cyanobacterium RM2_2_10]
MQETAPRREKQTGLQEREARRAESGKTKITIRLDGELIEEFKKRAGERGYQSLINRALREWLIKQGVTELLRAELGQLVGEAFASLKKEERTEP